MARKSKTRYTLLGLLSHEPMSGYEIKKRIEHSLWYFWNESYGQIYPTLRQLEQEGMVSMEIMSSENRPARKVYTITQKGLEDLHKWLASPIPEEYLRYEILLKLFIGNHASPSENLESLRSFLSRHQENFATLERLEHS